MSEAAALLDAGKKALEPVLARASADVPTLIVAADPAAWRDANPGSGASIAMTPFLAGRLAEGVDFMGPNDPDVAGHWACHGLPESGLDAMRRLVAPHGWSNGRIDRATPAERSVVQLDAVTQSALCRAVGAGVPVVFGAPTPDPAVLHDMTVVVTGTAREHALGHLLAGLNPPCTARFKMPLRVWYQAGAPLFGSAEFQFSQVVAGRGSDTILRDVLDDWVGVLRGMAHVHLWPPEAAQALSPLGALASDQVARPTTPPLPFQSVTLRIGQWLVVPHGWFKQVIQADHNTLILRHFWRF